MTPVTPDSSPADNRHTVTFNMDAGVVTIPTLLIDDDDDEVEEQNCCWKCWKATCSGCSLAATYGAALIYGMVNAIILPFHFMFALIMRVIFCPYLFLIVLDLSISFIYILPRNPSSSFLPALLYSHREVPPRMPPVPQKSTGTPTGHTKMAYWSSAMLYGLAFKLSLIAFCLFKHKLTKLYRYLTKKREVTIEDVEMQSVSHRASTPLPPRRGRGGRPVLMTSSVDRRPRTPIVRKSRGPARPQMTQSVPGSFEL